MNIMLGNLTVKQIQERLGIQLTPDEAAEMIGSRQERAKNIAPDKWHCFDIPFAIVCGSMETAIKIRDILAPYSPQMKEPIQIAIDTKKKEG